MNKETFGSIHKYKMLDFLTEKISLMDNKDKNYLSSVIQDINTSINKSKLINNIQFRNYVLELIYRDFKNKINNHILDKYKKEIATYLENYLYAKVKNSKQ